MRGKEGGREGHMEGGREGWRERGEYGRLREDESFHIFFLQNCSLMSGRIPSLKDETGAVSPVHKLTAGHWPISMPE